MTDQQHFIAPSLELQQEWLDLWGDHAIPRATRWGWKQRDASVADELQKARDEELEACLSWIRERTGPWTTEELRAARRPKPKSRAEEALALISHDPENQPFLSEEGIAIIRRALERLQELEGQSND